METQTVVMNEISRPSVPNSSHRYNSSLPDPTHPKLYETVGTESHEYEDLGKFQDESYEQIGQPRPPREDFDVTSCLAYAPTDVRRNATPTRGVQQFIDDGLYEN